MREIKFRAWTREGKMIPVGEMELFTDGSCRVNDEIPIGKDNLMQFIGLHDKNGKEIYEGDIVKISYLLSRGDKCRERINTVEWKAYSDREYVSNIECWMAGDEPLSDPGGLWGSGPHTYEVIGNAYENPKLLEKP